MAARLAGHRLPTAVNARRRLARAAAISTITDVSWPLTPDLRSTPPAAVTACSRS